MSNNIGHKNALVTSDNGPEIRSGSDILLHVYKVHLSSVNVLISDKTNHVEKRDTTLLFIAAITMLCIWKCRFRRHMGRQHGHDIEVNRGIPYV